MAGTGGLSILGMILGGGLKGIAAPVLDHFGKDSFVAGGHGQRYGHNAATVGSKVVENLGTMLTGASAPGVAAAQAEKYAIPNASSAQSAQMYHDQLMQLRQALDAITKQGAR
jgi:hypothetical protein